MTTAAEAPVVLEHPAEHVALVTLRRPHAHNAIDRATALALGRIVEEIEREPEIRVAVLSGAGGKAFCAGADLAEVNVGGMGGLFLDGGGFAAFVDAPRHKPWIAAVDGYALAGGCEIALACDMIVASETARFGLPEVARGLLAAAGGAYRLPRRIPRNIAIELIVTARMMSAAEAHRYGLVNRLVAGGEAVASAIALAIEVAANAPLAVRESLALARRSSDADDGMLGLESRAALTRLSVTEDYVEGPRAFLEKRPARWSGR